VLLGAAGGDRVVADMTGTMPSVARDIDALVAENRALRDELEALQQTHVGEVVAHNTELMHERNDLIRRNQALHAEVARLGGGVR